MLHRHGLAPWQLRWWLTACVFLLVGTWCLLIVGSIPPRGDLAQEPLPPWVMDGAIVVLTPYPLRVSGPNGEPWYLVRFSWRDVVMEAVFAGPFGERDATVLVAILTARMVGGTGWR